MPSTSSKITTTSRISLPQPPSSFALLFAPRFAMKISVLDCFDDDEGLRPGMVVGQRQMDVRGVTRRGHLREPFGRSAGERERRRARGGVDDADVLHKHAALEAGADGLGEDRKSTRLNSSH